MKKFYENKIFIIVSLFVIFGAVAVVASTIGDSGYSGIQVDNYFSGSGKQGITQDISFKDYDGNNHSFSFEDGLLVNYSVAEPAYLEGSLLEGLVAYYALEEPVGDVIDSTGNGNDATNNGATRDVSGKVGNAFYFDGVDDYVRKQTWSSMSSFSWSYWFNANEVNGSHILNQGGNPGAGTTSPFTGINAEGGLYFGGYNGVNDAPIFPGISTNQWYNLVGVYNGTHSFIYVNGELENVTAQPGISIITSNFYIGGNVAYYNSYFNGTIDEVGIWNRVLNTSEIQALYNDGEGLTYP